MHFSVNCAKPSSSDHLFMYRSRACQPAFALLDQYICMQRTGDSLYCARNSAAGSLLSASLSSILITRKYPFMINKTKFLYNSAAF